MSNYPQHHWPFRALDALSERQQQQWLDECYVRSGLDGVLLDPQRSVVIITEPGNGLSTSMKLLQLENSFQKSAASDQHKQMSSLLTFDYPPERWPVPTPALAQAPTHFELFMEFFADKCIETLKAQPEQLGLVPTISHEFLIWLVRRYLPPRRSKVWLHTLDQNDPSPELSELIAQARSGELEPLYTDNSPQNIKGQIEECLDLAQCLHWEGVYAVADISLSDWINRTAGERKDLRDAVFHLFQQLTHLQRPGFGFKIGLPSALLSQEDAQVLLRDRAEILTYAWNEKKLWQIADGMLKAAAGAPLSLRTLLPVGAWEELLPDIRAIWGKSCPAAMAAIARYAWEQQTVDQRTDHKLNAIRMKLYANHAPLRRDPEANQPIVWRGALPLRLNQAQLRLFDFLWQQRGRFVQTDEIIDLEIANSDSHIDKLVSRIRQVIEPDPNCYTPVYLHRASSQGMWLENCAFR